MLSIKPAYYLSLLELNSLFQGQPVISGHYLVRLVLNTQGQISEFVRCQREENDGLAMKAGTDPYRMPDGGYSVNGWLIINTLAQHPGCLRLTPNTVVLPQGDYLFSKSPTKRLCFSLQGITSNRQDALERFGTVRLSDDGDSLESFHVGERISPEAFSSTDAVSGDGKTIPAIIGKQHACLLSIPIPA